MHDGTATHLISLQCPALVISLHGGMATASPHSACVHPSVCCQVISVGAGTHGFTLDPSSSEFVLSHPAMRIPERGQIYSLNDAR